MQRCSRCGRMNPPNYRFCADCHAFIGGEGSRIPTPEEKAFLEKINKGASGSALSDDTYSSRWLMVAVVSLAALLVLYATVRLVVSGPGRRAPSGYTQMQEPATGDVPVGTETLPAASSGTEAAAPVTAPTGQAAESTAEKPSSPNTVETSRPRKWPSLFPRQETQPAGRTATSAPPGTASARPASGIAVSGRAPAAGTRAGTATVAAPAAAAGTTTTEATRRPASGTRTKPEDTRTIDLSGEIRLPEAAPKRDPDFGGPVIIVKGTPPLPKPVVTAPQTNLGNAGSVRYQENIADTYLQLGQKREAARVLDTLLKRDISQEDRNRLESKLQLCKE